MVVANFGLALRQIRSVRSGYWRYRSRAGVTGLDLLQEAALGLMTAVGRFDPVRGNAFSTYAVQWIRQAVDRAYLDNRFTARLPVHFQSEYRTELADWEVAREDVEPVEEVVQIAATICEASAISVERALPLANALAVAEPLSIDWLVERAELASNDYLRGEPLVWKEDILGNRDAEHDRLTLRAELEMMLMRLPSRESEILKRRVGWGDGIAGDGSPATLAAIGATLDLTRERVRQLEAKAIGRLFKRARPPSVREGARNRFK